MRPEVCAVVVTYHPDGDVDENITLLRSQVTHLVVIDNGSSPEALDRLRLLSQSLQFELIENARNRGLALALNQGILAARGYPWVLFFDQDSRVTDGFTQTMLAFAEATPPQRRVAITVPRYIDKRFGHLLPPSLTKDGDLAFAMTSGSLMQTALFETTGSFEDLFIYEIDREFCLRVRSMGFRLQECSTATLLHSPASPEPVCLAGRRLFYAENYSLTALYYRQRNRTVVRRRYARAFPEHFRGRRRRALIECLKILLAEPAKLKKIATIVLGAYDGMTGRMGGRTGL